jgi:hypothetical protein
MFSSFVRILKQPPQGPISKDGIIMNIPPFRSGQSAHQAHRALKQSIEIMDRAQHGTVLWFAEILKRRLFFKLGYSSIYQYAAEELGFSTTRTGDFKRLAEKLEVLPRIAAKVESGELGYTKAREIVKVANPATENGWLAVAAQQSRRELEATVKHAKKLAAQSRLTNPAQTELVPREKVAAPPAFSPVRIGFEMTPIQYARYEALVARMGTHENKAELLLDMMEAYLASDENAPRGASGPHYQIHVHECPTCAKTTVQGDSELTHTEAKRVHCDATVNLRGRRSKNTIPPRIRREVLARDRHRCRRKGCNHSRFLEIHHIVPRSRGGTHDPTNLVTLCSNCHQLWHENGGDLTSLLSDRIGSSEILIPQPGRAPECSKPPANT